MVPNIRSHLFCRVGIALSRLKVAERLKDVGRVWAASSKVRKSIEKQIIGECKYITDLYIVGDDGFTMYLALCFI